MPISPEEVAKHKHTTFPKFVFDAFDFLIASKYCNGSATVVQKDAVAKIKELGASDPAWPSSGFNHDWLNIEEAYESVGWRVEYDKPDYTENYDAYFKFSKRKRG